MKMFLWDSRWMCLLTLTLVMLVTAVRGRSSRHPEGQSEENSGFLAKKKKSEVEA